MFFVAHGKRLGFPDAKKLSMDCEYNILDSGYLQDLRPTGTGQKILEMGFVQIPLPTVHLRTVNNYPNLAEYQVVSITAFQNLILFPYQFELLKAKTLYSSVNQNNPESRLKELHIEAAIQKSS
jgi:hypothetical protein